MKKPPSTLAKIAADVSACHLCPLAEKRTKAVPGEGPSDAKVILVGEAPGRDEDLSGRPFVGRAGRVLASTLEDLGTSRKEVYITNVVKCRPPRNRVPRKLEQNTCMQAHLRRELEALRPEIVVLLGRTATASVLGVKKLAEVRGRPEMKRGVTYLPTFHPAAILRNPRLRRTFQKDLRLALSART